MFSDIMVPLDGNRFAEHAIPVAAALARRHGARVHVVAVSPPARIWMSGNGLSPEVPAADLSELDRITERELGGYLQRVAGNLTRSSGIIAHAVLLEGVDPVGDQLVEYVRLHRIKLVVMHTHARNPLARMWLGSVANVVLHQSGIPCLLLRGPSTGSTDPEVRAAGPARIMVPVDGSPEADFALDLALAIARPDVSEVHLLAVIPPGPRTTADQRSLPERIAALQEHLSVLSRRAEEAGLSPLSHVVMQNEPAQVILDVMARERIDMVTIAAHHRSAIDRVIMGSVVDHLLRHSRVPMLVWRSRAPEGARLGLESRRSTQSAQR